MAEPEAAAVNAGDEEANEASTPLEDQWKAIPLAEQVRKGWYVGQFAKLDSIFKTHTRRLTKEHPLRKTNTTVEGRRESLHCRSSVF